MSKTFIAWSAAVVALMATANSQSYTLGTLFGAAVQSADKTVNRTHK